MKLIAVVILFLIYGCSVNNDSDNKLFRLLSPDDTNINFSNQLKYDKDFNIYTYRNFYNGGGVALGDINNDGLTDIFFTANMLPNKLYLNKGGMHFEDITNKAQITKKGRWSTGVSMADVNGDGLLDIYVCNSGDIKGDNKKNELYINNGNLTFSEKAHEYGLADNGFSTHAAFFDFDRDGDLDMYLLNNSFRAIGSFDLRQNERTKRDSAGGDKLFRNDNNHFTDISEQAGIYGSVIGFGLGLTVSDVNRDGWQDIYVSNDFFERDYLYINNHDGTFREELDKQMMSISNASMGSDIADINNDGYPDIFTTEMLPSDEKRLKMNVSFESWDKYQLALANGYYHQFTRNALQLNNRNNSFSEIGRLAGVEATDWSWGALIADFDNDSRKDIFVANGIYQDLTNQDYIQYISNQELVRSLAKNNGIDFKKLIDIIPSNPIPNCVFKNVDGLSFSEKATDWGLNQPSFSNGSAYGDLDNDGDLDLVVNNVNMPCFVYSNQSDRLKQNNYLRVNLKGKDKNSFALGASVTIYCGTTALYQEQMPMRGFQSTVDHRLTFGLGEYKTADSIIINWPDDTRSVIREVQANREIVVMQNKAEMQEPASNSLPAIYKEASDHNGINYYHHQNNIVDFDRDRLLFQNYSSVSPAIAKADVNKDGLEDIYISGTREAPGGLYLQKKNGSFQKIIIDEPLNASDCVFFDADNDDDPDLYVATGGSAPLPNSASLADRLYLNDGKGNFIIAPKALPEGIFESNSTVTAADFDKDGDMDLFVGVRFRVLKYGYPCKGYILQNDGKANFTDVTSWVAPELHSVGMVTDAEWFDHNKDGFPDLVVSGEYMPVKLFINNSGILKQTRIPGLENTNGWWNRVKITDINGDGLDDIIALNHGLNSRFQCSSIEPVTMYVGDFDENGAVEQIVCCYNGNKQYPMALRHDLLSVLPSLKKKFLKYEDYSGRQIHEIFSREQLEKSIKLDAFEMHSCVLLNRKDSFERKYLPIEAQLSPMYAVEVLDVDNDGNTDVIVGGNFYKVKPEIGIYDAGYGLLLKGDGTGNFKPVSPAASGINVRGEIRDIVSIKNGNKNLLLFAMNNEPIRVFTK